MRPLALIRGAGDLGTAVGRRLHVCGFSVVHLEVPRPTVIRRSVAFASAVFEGRATVEGVTALLARNVSQIPSILDEDRVAVLVDPDASSLYVLDPVVVVDAILAKRNTGTRRAMAPHVVALGPGFTAGADVHAVVETCRGHDLGRVIASGAAQPDTGIPGMIDGAGAERVLRAPAGGVFRPHRLIGERLRSGELVAEVGGRPVRTPLEGVLRGVLYPGLEVHQGQKVADVDPRGERAHCFTISDKANAVAGGVLEAVLREDAVRGLVLQGGET